jgi:hypothetical protein
MDTGTIHLGPFEEQYEQLISEALEQGAISAEERQRLDLAAEALGLDRDRAARLEAALRAANAARSRETLSDPEELDPTIGRKRRRRHRASLPSLADSSEQLTLVREEAVTLPGGADIAETNALRGRYAMLEAQRDVDAQFRTASVLACRRLATFAQRQFYEANRSSALPRPKRGLSPEAWALLFHPEQERLTGDIFALIASAALIGRISAMRADHSLPRLDPNEKQDPRTSTTSAVRALSWSAATLGMHPPPIYVTPSLDCSLEIVTAAPPVTRVGARMLKGRDALSLAFHCGRHLTWYRQEYFVCTLVPTINDLSDLFVAALSIGAPELDLRADVRERTKLIAEAILPVLEPSVVERLRLLVARFVAQGGRTSLQDWVRTAGWTACRAGLLLCGDLEVACGIVSGESGGLDRARELERFWSSDEASELRHHLGVALGG